MPVPVGAPRGPILDAEGAPLAMTRDVVQLGIAPGEVRDRTALARGPGARGRLRCRGSAGRWMSVPDGSSSRPVCCPDRPRPRRRCGGSMRRRCPSALLLGPPGVAADRRTRERREASGPTESRRPSIVCCAATRAAPWFCMTPWAARSNPRPARRRAANRRCGRADDQPQSAGDLRARAGRCGHPHGRHRRRHRRARSARRVDPRARQPAPAFGAAAATTLTEPFEPGSTLKPFIAAALLGRGPRRADRCRRYARGPTRHQRADAHRRALRPAMTLRDVIRWSSNVGIAQFAQRLSPGQRNTRPCETSASARPPAFRFPASPPGRLRDPIHWSSSRRRRWPSATSSRSPRSNWRWPMARSQTAASCSSRHWCARFGRRMGR